MAIFSFLLLKICWNTYFILLFWTWPKNWQKNGPKKNDNFSHFAKQRLIKKKKKHFVATPLLTKNVCLFKLSVLKPKTLMLNKKHNLKWGKTKIRKRNLKEKRQETKKRENIDEEKNLQLNFFDVVPFMKEKQRRKKKKERDKNNEPKDSKITKTRRKKERKEKEGGQKRLREKERETLKINKKCPFLGENKFFCIKQPKNKKPKTKNKKKKQQKQIRRV